MLLEHKQYTQARLNDTTNLDEISLLEEEMRTVGLEIQSVLTKHGWYATYYLQNM